MLSIQEYINCFLVRWKVRPAYLFQPIDYIHSELDDECIMEKIHAIRSEFTDLYITPCSQGFVVAFHPITDSRILETNIGLANLLGFPCTIPDSETKRSVEIGVLFKDGSMHPLLAYLCEHTKDEYVEHAHCMAMKMKEILQSNTNIYQSDIKDVFVTTRIHYPKDYFISRLMDWSTPFTTEEMEEVDNILYNIGFSEILKDYVFNTLDFDNALHRGILIGLLTYSKYPPVSPFYPLSDHPKERNEVDNQIQCWENLLMNVFEGKL